MNNKEKTDQKAAIGLLALGLIGLTLLAFAIGIGYLFGAGAGWIAVGMIGLLSLYGLLKFIAAIEKEEKQNER